MNDAANWQEEIGRGQRFKFGENWLAFLDTLSPERILRAEDSLKEMLELENLEGRSFLDAGSGSGLFSLAARRLGARVHSFDYDAQSVACTAELKQRYFPDDELWRVEAGSVLDKGYLNTLGTFDIVYSWGVLHHTGNMWEALGNVADLVAARGRLFIAIYNDQGAASRRWTGVKRAYVRSPAALKKVILAGSLLHLWGPTIVRDSLRGKPLRTWRAYSRDNSRRGMDPWRDVVDWVGGYPFEVAAPGQLLAYARNRGFTLAKMTTCGGGLGCNEFVFERE